MATSKTLTPTNVTIQIPAMTDAPDQSVNSNCIDKLGDAVNTLNSQIANSCAIVGTPISITVSLETAGDFTAEFSAPTAPTGYTLRGYVPYFNSYRGFVRGIGGTNYCYYTVASATSASVNIVLLPIFSKT